MLTFLGRVRQQDWMDASTPRLLSLQCIADEAAAGVRTNWYASLQDLLSKVFWGEIIDYNTTDAATGRVEVDICMARWRESYHSTTVWSGLPADPRTAPSDGVTMCTYHAWLASDLPTDGSHGNAAPCITVPTVSY
jgi:hypothetical protein